MTRKEKELKVLELFGLKIGDKIKVEEYDYILEIKEFEDRIVFERKKEGGTTEYLFINVLTIYDWEKIETPLEIPLKDKKCNDFKCCEECPFVEKNIINCVCIEDYEKMTLEEKYNEVKKEFEQLTKEILGDKNNVN